MRAVAADRIVWDSAPASQFGAIDLGRMHRFGIAAYQVSNADLVGHWILLQLGGSGVGLSKFGTSGGKNISDVAMPLSHQTRTDFAPLATL